MELVLTEGLVEGDFFERVNEIAAESVDLILTDPPFGMTACKWDKKLNLPLMWSHFERIIKKDGVMAIFSAQPFTIDLIESNRKNFKYCWYWLKNQGTMFFHTKRMPIRKIEEICIFYKKGRYFPQKKTGQTPTHAAKGCSNGTVYHGTNKRDYAGGSTDRFPTNVLDFKCVDNYSRQHPSEKPVDLLEYLIQTYTIEDERVLDPFCGSGSTLIAARNLSRKYVGFENDPEHFKTAIARLNS